MIDIPNKTTYPKIDLLVCGQDAQSLSLYTLKFNSFFYLYKITCPGDALMYLTILRATLK